MQERNEKGKPRLTPNFQTVNGWKDLDRLGDAHRTCTGAKNVEDPNCSLNVGADGTPGHATPRDLESPAPGEDVGIGGTKLDELPGGKVPTGETPVARKVRRSGRVFRG